MSGVAGGKHVTPNVRLVRPLGAGGMGSVWLADHLALKTQVVVKFMLGELRASSSARARFGREAAAAAQVKSPHVVQVFDHGVTDDGVPFIVMEHLEGRSLGDLLREGGPLPPAEVASIVSQMCRALGRVHAAGILHRDIKPDNVFLLDGEGDERYFVKLLDFGIAKNVERDREGEGGEGSERADTTQTKTGQVVGTPYYMSPEQVTAQKDPDHTSDLWSVGVLAYEAMVGARPFEGNSFGGIAVAIASAPIPVPSRASPELPPAVDAWFARACSRERAGRFETAKELGEALRRAVGDPQALSGSGSGSRSGPRPLEPVRGHDELGLAPTLADGPSSPVTGEAASVEVTLARKGGRGPLAIGLGLAFVAGVALVVAVLARPFGPSGASVTDSLTVGSSADRASPSAGSTIGRAEVASATNTAASASAGGASASASAGAVGVASASASAGGVSTGASASAAASVAPHPHGTAARPPNGEAAGKPTAQHAPSAPSSARVTPPPSATTKPTSTGGTNDIDIR